MCTRLIVLQYYVIHCTFKTSKEAIVARAGLLIPISVLCQLNKTIILFGSNFGNKIRVHIWIIHEILYEIDIHFERLKFLDGKLRLCS